MRKSVAVLCNAIAVFATILSAIDFMAPALVLAAAWQMVPIPGVVDIRSDDTPCREQTTALLSLVLSRPPPCSVVVS